MKLKYVLLCFPILVLIPLGILFMSELNQRVSEGILFFFAGVGAQTLFSFAFKYFKKS